MLPISILPSLPANKFEEIVSLADSMKGLSTELQIDIVDGVYVPLQSWPFTTQDPKTELYKLTQFTDDFAVEMDCMVMYPEKYLDIFVSIGVKKVIVHVGSTQKYTEIITHAQTHGYKIGFAFTNDTPLDVLYQYIDGIDYIQLMGIREVGQQGQDFDTRTLARARQLRSQFPELEIAVDGSVNKHTIPQLYESGVTRFAPGSAVAKADDPAASYKQLRELVTK